jgi:hypothetical protein
MTSALAPGQPLSVGNHEGDLGGLATGTLEEHGQGASEHPPPARLSVIRAFCAVLTLKATSGGKKTGNWHHRQAAIPTTLLGHGGWRLR